MRIYPFCLLLIVAALALVTAATQTNCIIGCKCAEKTPISKTVKIQECDSPLILSEKTLVGVSNKIVVISFKNVFIERIEKDAFRGFDELEKVIIEDSSIGSLDANVFDLPELGTLQFARTTFGEVPSVNSQYIEELIFDDCKLTQVPKIDLPALNFINLANNLIKEIDENAFAKVDSLEEVTLSNNSISKLPPNLFSTNRDFNTLNLDYNPLNKFELVFSGEDDSGMEYLSLRHCKLTTFDRSASKYLSEVTSLDLSGNEISVLPIDAFEPMKKLNNLYLSDNKLVELDDDIFLENSKLDKIILDNNAFVTLPNFQTKSKSFQTFIFSCKNCGLISVAGAFDNMPLLVTVDLSNNKLQDIDGVFTEMRHLKELSLSNNQITTITINAFAKNSELETLDLSNNPLLPLDPVVLTSVPSLKKLNVSDSNLEKLWSNYNAELPSLEQLFVKKNKLAVITVSDLMIAPKLKMIELQENPLMCNQELLEYVVKKSIHPTTSGVKTHESLAAKVITVYDPKLEWEAILPKDCLDDDFYDDDDEIDNELDTDDNNYKTDEDTEIEDDESDDDDNDDDIDIEASVLNTRGFNLAKASYILSITSVFILTALLVLFVAVMVTLLILKRNKSFNMHNGNLPRLKIPLWHTTPGQKKHSGSVYKPLSEDLSGPRTPIINRYEFKQTPQVHNSLP